MKNRCNLLHISRGIGLEETVSRPTGGTLTFEPRWGVSDGEMPYFYFNHCSLYSIISAYLPRPFIGDSGHNSQTPPLTTRINANVNHTDHWKHDLILYPFPFMLRCLTIKRYYCVDLCFINRPLF